jgi:hypothetical protein
MRPLSDYRAIDKGCLEDILRAIYRGWKREAKDLERTINHIETNDPDWDSLYKRWDDALKMMNRAHLEWSGVFWSSKCHVIPKNKHFLSKYLKGKYTHLRLWHFEGHSDCLYIEAR